MQLKEKENVIGKFYSRGIASAVRSVPHSLLEQARHIIPGEG